MKLIYKSEKVYEFFFIQFSWSCKDATICPNGVGANECFKNELVGGTEKNKVTWIVISN